MPPKEYEIITGLVLVIIIFLLAAFFNIVLIVYLNQRKKKHLEEKQRMESNFRNEILQTQLEIQEQTFKNISQEIHDNIGQVLTLVKLNINTMNAKDPAALDAKINDSKHLVSKAIQDLRDLSKSINTDYVKELGLIRSIEYELELLQRTGDYEIRFLVSGNACRLEQQQELIFFRILQEALHNILKHAKATAIEVQLIFDPQTFILQITDNGTGLDIRQIELNNHNRQGLGIKSMRNRAAMIKTDLQILSTPEKGTTLTLTLPLQTPKL